MNWGDGARGPSHRFAHLYLGTASANAGRSGLIRCPCPLLARWGMTAAGVCSPHGPPVTRANDAANNFFLATPFGVPSATPRRKSVSVAQPVHDAARRLACGYMTRRFRCFLSIRFRRLRDAVPRNILPQKPFSRRWILPARTLAPTVSCSVLIGVARQQLADHYRRRHRSGFTVRCRLL